MQSRNIITEESISSGSDSNASSVGDATGDAELKRENEELKLALLGMRKKLLSLSASASATASENVASSMKVPY